VGLRRDAGFLEREAVKVEYLLKTQSEALNHLIFGGRFASGDGEVSLILGQISVLG